VISWGLIMPSETSTRITSIIYGAVEPDGAGGTRQRGEVVHVTHKTRFSDASTFDLVCERCGATDAKGYEKLSQPCEVEP
jgi:hypothetical protein